MPLIACYSVKFEFFLYLCYLYANIIAYRISHTLYILSIRDKITKRLQVGKLS
jgi:hypothetical protein